MTAVAITPGKIVATETKVAEDASFSAFYDANRDQLVRAVWASIRDRDLAAEAVDEAFTRAYGRWDQLSEAGNIAGWVFRTAVNWSISRFRKLDTRRRLGFKAAQDGFFIAVTGFNTGVHPSKIILIDRSNRLVGGIVRIKP